MDDRPGTGYGGAFAAAVFAALAAAASLILVYGANPAFWPPLQLIPSLGSGFYPIERHDAGAFCWTGERASLRLDGLDRRVAWACDIRVRSGRPNGAALPLLSVAADEGPIASGRVTGDPGHISFTIPVEQERRGVTLTFTPSSTFSPPGSDRRILGVVVEDLACQPVAGIPLPPRRTLGQASLAGAILGAGFGLLQVTPGTAVGAAVAVAGLQAIPLALGTAPYLVLGAAAAWLALIVSILLVACVRLTPRLRGVPWRNTAKFVAAFTAGILYLKLLVILHPEAAPATQAAATLPVLMAGRVLDVLRVGLDAVTGLALYWVGCRLLRDRLAAAGSVVLYHLAPPAFAAGPAHHASALAAPLVVLAVAGVVALESRRARGVLALLAAWTLAGFVIASLARRRRPVLPARPVSAAGARGRRGRDVGVVVRAAGCEDCDERCLVGRPLVGRRRVAFDPVSRASSLGFGPPDETPRS